MSTGRDAWRLAVGTLTAFRVQPPAVVDRAVAGRAMLLAPLATLPLAAAPLLAHVAVRWIGMPPLLAAALTVAYVPAGCHINLRVARRQQQRSWVGLRCGRRVAADHRGRRECAVAQ